MISIQEKNELKAKLLRCSTVQEVFDILENIYDLDNAKLGPLTKSLFVDGAIKGIIMMNPKKRAS